MKHLILLIGLLFVTSCNNQTDLEQIKIDERIPFDISNLNRDKNEYRLNAYSVDEISNYKVGNIPLKSFTTKDKNRLFSNKLYLIINNYNENKFLGYSFASFNEPEQKIITTFFKEKYGNPNLFSEDKDKDKKAMAWIVDDKWILLNIHSFRLTQENLSKEERDYIYTELLITVIKKDTKVDNIVPDTSILELFKAAHIKE